MNPLRSWIRIEFGGPTFGGFMAGLVGGSFLGGIAALVTGWTMAFVWASLATGLAASFFVRSSLEP